MELNKKLGYLASIGHTVISLENKVYLVQKFSAATFQVRFHNLTGWDITDFVTSLDIFHQDLNQIQTKIERTKEQTIRESFQFHESYKYMLWLQV